MNRHILFLSGLLIAGCSGGEASAPLEFRINEGGPQDARTESQAPSPPGAGFIDFEGAVHEITVERCDHECDRVILNGNCLFEKPFWDTHQGIETGIWGVTQIELTDDDPELFSDMAHQPAAIVGPIDYGVLPEGADHMGPPNPDPLEEGFIYVVTATRYRPCPQDDERPGEGCAAVDQLGCGFFKIEDGEIVEVPAQYTY